MKIAIWRTGHEIADTVATALAFGLDADLRHVSEAVASVLESYDCHIAYGILRGTADIFAGCERLGKPWFNIDRGYFSPGHYDGFYRVSLRGTQHTQGMADWMLDDRRLAALGIEFKPWRGRDPSKPVLVCPPTQAVKQFFDIEFCHYSAVIRQKGDPTPIHFDDYDYVVTFNSSVGWQMLQAGIPCVSDKNYSIIGSMQKIPFPDTITANTMRRELFTAMSNLQLTLSEIRAGALWPLMRRLIYLSAGTGGKPSPAMSLPIAWRVGQNTN